MSGYTLALDLKLGRNLFESVNKLDEIAYDMGGTIYLTKDSLMSEKFSKKHIKDEEFEIVREKYVQ